MPKEELNDSERQIGACAYLLHGLLQRLDAQQPGLLDEMIDGVSSDRESMVAVTTDQAESGVQIADEALKMLRLMRAQLQQ